MKKILFFLLFLLVALTPIIAFAQFAQIAAQPGVSLDFRAIMKNVANIVWYIFAGMAIIMFLIAGILFLTANGNPGKIETARLAVIWGIVGVIVGLLAGGIINFVVTSFFKV